MDKYIAHNRYIDQTKYSWTVASTKLLLENIRQRKEIINNKDFFQKKMWDEIAEELNVKEHLVNGEQCSSKWKNLKKKYKHIKDSSNKTGACGKPNWEYFDIIDEIMFSMPEIYPVSIAYSISDPVSTGRPQITEGTNDDEHDPEIIINNNAACCSNVSASSQTRVIKRRTSIRAAKMTIDDIYEQRERHHRENAKLKKEFLNLMKKHLEE
ncbi:uncharacterized protein [Prorops nasuta]|uniref:uncharacterized protein n=1 Tax=Prorops nasuta TaxID=863751 RepID=UPI0034CDB14D